VIRAAHKKSYEAYGYGRTWKALLRAGERASRCQVQRLMREHGIQGAKRRGKQWRTTKPDPGARRSADLVGREFTATAPNRLWVGDFTYLRCWEGLVFFAFILDVYSRMIVGWQLASRMRTDLVGECAADRVGDARARRRGRARRAYRRRLAVHEFRVHAGARRRADAGVDRSQTVTTMRWPNRGSTTRPS
jgi:hypothetical protein